MRENEIARRVGEGIADEFAESHKDGTARLLVMRHAPRYSYLRLRTGESAILYRRREPWPLSVTAEHAKSLLSRVERTLLSAAFDVGSCGLGESNQQQVKGGGQECPPYTQPISIPPFTFSTWPVM